MSYNLLKLKRTDEALALIENQHSIQDSLHRAGAYVVNELVFAKLVLAEVLLGRDNPALAVQYASAATQMVKERLPEVVVYRIYATFVKGKALLADKQYKAVQREMSEIIHFLNTTNAAGFDDMRSLYLWEMQELLARSLYEEGLARGDHHLPSAALAAIREAQSALYASWSKIDNQDNLRFALIENYKTIETSLRINQTCYSQTGDKRYLLESLQWMDLSRNVQLRASLRKNEIAHELGIPKALLDEAFALNRKLWDFTNQQNQRENTLEKQALQDSILHLKNALTEVQDAIFKIHPDFIRKSHQNRALDQKTLENYMRQSGQTIFTYAVGEDHSFVVAMSQRGYRFAHYPIGRDSLQALVNTIRTAVAAQPDAPADADRQALAATSHQLYEMFMGFAEPIMTDRVVVIADGPLEILPFSLLLTEPTDGVRIPFNRWPFAVRKASFSYAFALDMLLDAPAPPAKANRRGILAFAPSFERVPTSDAFAFRALGELAYNREEVSNLTSRFAGKAYLDEDATSEQFKTSAPDYSVIHLATHATADTRVGDFSYLSFSTTEYGNDDLKVGDLYGMDLPAELVVLSACETGLGEWRRGEGVVGLERAFTYAGAQSLVSTHWKVSDRASADLMALFYDYLAQGLPKDVALQRAQLAFIDTHDAWLTHPFFWAGYVQKGSTAPLSLPHKRAAWPYYGLALFSISGLGWLLWKRKRLV